MSRGEGEKDSFPRYLTVIIWPKDKAREPKKIETIEVRKVSDKTLSVKAITKGIVKKESTFVEGKDFAFSDGRIVLNREGGIMPGEALMIGAYVGSEVLGIDSSGHGKYRQSGAIAGLVVGLFPLALGVKEDVRFIRLSK